ncbi:MAG: N-acetylmuramoyl-L-alanine amidase [Leptospiraceae bacterium]|nr:N-acetylmuramoyl-L-alanine amidase [Leptospiraceae bacterium]MCB1317339.1 N-acetylmuramoyl-L-alanine amidase [Leptospiraceae bacterium]
MLLLIAILPITTTESNVTVRPERKRGFFPGKWVTVCLLLLLPGLLYCDPPAPQYTVVLDPGHGGAPLRRPDDKWDVVTGKYLSYYAPGMTARDENGRLLHEHLVTLDLARAVKQYLDWTHSDQGWRKFSELLNEFSDQNTYERIVIDARMSRKDSWNHRFRSTEHPEVNAPYRLYDFPDPESGKMRNGRISFINRLQPHLVVSLHTNPAGAGHDGGMAAVLSPGYETFEMIRRIHLNDKPVSFFQQSPWYGKWLVTDPGWSQYEAARADTWVYFNGWRTNRSGTAIDRNKNRGIRYNMFNWRYRDPPGWEKLHDESEPGPYATAFREFRAEGPFWDRERGQAESWRREGGVMGYGGDNHLATDELMRFVQYGVRRLEPGMRSDAAIGPILNPYVSTYSLPTFVNAICAYLEIAHLNRLRDRKLIIQHRDEVARSLAVGIYSLFRGLHLRGEIGPYQPRGNPIQFERYENLPEGNYFERVIID